MKYCENIIDKLEAANYEENIQAKMIRIWDQIP
jgi:hypothetical protein